MHARTKIQASSDATNHKYFDKTFASDLFSAADIVIVMLGYDDSRLNVSPQDTADHIQKISTVLTNMNKLVILFNVPTFGDLKNPQGEALRALNMTRNELLNSFIVNE